MCSVSAEPSIGFFKALGNEFNIKNVDLNLCTHLTYAYMDTSQSMFNLFNFCHSKKQMKRVKYRKYLVAF